MNKATAKELVNYGPTLRGECDRCHRTPVELHEYDDEPGSWTYCERCLQVYAGFTHKVGSWRVNAEGMVVGA